MRNDPFWYIDDEQRVRWAVGVSRPRGGVRGGESRIVFTSLERRIAIGYTLAKEQSELTRHDLLELLNRAKVEELSRPREQAPRQAVAA